MKRIVRGLSENQAATDPASEDQTLLGRTYAIRFEDVWQASYKLCNGGLRGWRVLSSDDQRGVIEAVAKALVLRREDDVRVEIQLDKNAQTRVDLWSASRKNRANLGRNRRLIGAFLHRLDRYLKVKPGQILDPTIASEWHDTH